MVFNIAVHCTISWENRNVEGWVSAYERVRKASLLQSYPYAIAVCRKNGQRPLFGRVEIDGIPAGLCLALEAALFGRVIHGVILDMGPLWFDGFGNADHFQAFIQAYLKDFPRRFGRRHRIIPAMEGSPALDNFLTAQGLKPHLQAKNYQTLWLDLTLDEEILRNNLKKNWRGSLRKAEKSDMSIVWDNSLQAFQNFMVGYKIDRNIKKYDGPSRQLLNALYHSFAQTNNVLIAQALVGKECVANALILKHGVGATYQAGWSTQKGRAHCAMHMILWGATHMLKCHSIQDFDLGGVNDDTAETVKKFKQGMGGTLVRTMGLYT